MKKIISIILILVLSGCIAFYTQDIEYEEPKYTFLHKVVSDDVIIEMFIADNVIDGKTHCTPTSKDNGFLIPLSSHSNDIYRVVPDYECKEAYRFLINGEPMRIPNAIANNYLNLKRLVELDYPMKYAYYETIYPSYINNRTIHTKFEDGSEQKIIIMELYPEDQADLVKKSQIELTYDIDGELYLFVQSGEYRFPLFMLEVTIDGLITNMYQGIYGVEQAIEDGVIMPQFVVDNQLPGIDVYILE